jgi:hypothetical protein
MSHTENQINVLDADYEKKKQKLHPAPENQEEDSHLKKKKKSTPRSPSEDKENKQTVEEGEIPLEEHGAATDKSARKKSASRSRSNYKNKSKSHMKSKSKSRSKTRAIVQENEETENIETVKGEICASAYSLRPRNNVDYSKISPNGNNNSAANEEPKSEDKSDVSFRVEDAKDPEEPEGEIVQIVEGEKINQAEEQKLPEDPSTEQNPQQEVEANLQEEEEKVSDSSVEENPDDLKQELHELKGILLLI